MDISKLIISEEQWAAMDETERTAAVREGRANTVQIKQGLENGSDELRAACENALSERMSATEEMIRRAGAVGTDALSRSAAQALKNYNRRLAQDRFFIGSAAFEASFTAQSAIEHVVEELNTKRAALLGVANASSSFLEAARAASESALAMLGSVEMRTAAAAFAGWGLPKPWVEGLASAADTRALVQATLGAHLAHMSELSVLAEGALARIDWGGFAGSLRVPTTLADLAKDRFLGFAQSHEELLASFRGSETALLTLPPEYSILSTQEFFIGSRLAESVSVEEVGDREPSDESDEVQREISEETSDKLAALLRCLDPSLIRLRDGAVRALSSDNPDRVRHAVTSYRELFTHVLHRLSPEAEFTAWSTSPKDYDKGKPTRRARLRFICRHINQGAYIGFVEKDVEAMLSMVDLFQQGTHGIDPAFNEAQLALFHVRVEAMIRFMLEIGRGGD